MLLLFFLFAFVAGCGLSGEPTGAGESGAPSDPSATAEADSDGEKSANAEDEPESSGGGVRSITPEDVLSEEELAAGAPEYRDWETPTDAEVVSLPGSEGTSAGAIPAVKPFNFGRDPGGPDDKTLYLTVPAIGLRDVPVYNELSEEALTDSTVHHPGTGFPWQAGANTFIAGHRIGYEGTGSWQVFYDVPSLVAGDEVIVTDSEGGEYVYRVTGQQTVGTDNVASMNPPEDGSSVISLQTCTLPDYSERIIVRGEFVEGDAV
ncbi:class E sortase [Rubrobacter radiotolerans]|uniref:class E sortase n=1 Tax=Rubrobacter radiotolerans TaxID=42256 RepID=UPI00056ED958|nr:class E sortase [Rubrobacter radiotolerans]